MARNDDPTRGFSSFENAAACGALPCGARVGDYVIAQFIAQGGCGSVYAAMHSSTGRRVALKVLHEQLAALPKMVERFAREVAVVQQLRHPNIVEIYEVGELTDRRPFYAMEYLDAVTLNVVLRERGRLWPEEALGVLDPVCAALSAAHANGIVHRDVKASNIVITRGEPRRVLLLDFGIAKLIEPEDSASRLTSAGRQPGTLTIMAPEQILGLLIDARTDVYALGVLLHRMLTGRLPFEARDPGELARQHLEEPAPRPSQRAPLAPALDAVVLRCLEKQPEARFDSASSFLSALRQAIGAVSGAEEPPPSLPAMGVGLYLELFTRPVDDDVDDAWGDDIGHVLDLAEERLRGGGFLLPAVTGNDILGVKVLSADPAQRGRDCQAALDFAATLQEEISLRPTRDDRVHVNLCMHVDALIVRRALEPEIVGGELVRTSAWAPEARVLGLCATAKAAKEVSGFRMVAGPGALFTFTRSRGATELHAFAKLP